MKTTLVVYVNVSWYMGYGDEDWDEVEDGGKTGVSGRVCGWHTENP